MKKAISTTLFGMLLGVATTALFAANVPADAKDQSARLNASEIVNRNVTARGGLQAWRSVKSIVFKGSMEAGGKTNEELPFVLEMKRGRKSRLELKFRGQTAMQVYDGTNGWKVRPYLNRADVEAYTSDEVRRAAAQAELDGPLVDYAEKGSKVELINQEKLEDHDTYKLKLTTRDGIVRHIWVDRLSYLEVAVEEQPKRLDGKLHNVATFYQEYRPVEGGLLVPFQFETKVEGIKQTEKIKVEKVLVNPALEDSLFSKPR